MGQKAKTEIIIRDLQSVVRRIVNMLKQSHGLKLHRVQTILRQLRIDKLLIDGFVKQMYYSQNMHETTFQ